MRSCFSKTKRKDAKAEIDRLLELLSIWEKVNDKDELKKSIREKIKELEEIAYDSGFAGDGYPS